MQAGFPAHIGNVRLKQFQSIALDRLIPILSYRVAKRNGFADVHSQCASLIDLPDFSG
jgi:hypothetical protein